MMSTAVTFAALTESWPAGSATCAVATSRTARLRLSWSRVVTDGITPTCDIRLGGSADLVGVGAGDADGGDLCGAACSAGQSGPLFSLGCGREMAGGGVWFQWRVSVACGGAVMLGWCP